MTYGQCLGCGAIAWELLDGRSEYCMDCDPEAYREPDWDDEDEWYEEAAEA